MNLIGWSLPLEDVYLESDEIHIWLCNLDVSEQSIKKSKEILSIAEIEKANKFHFLNDKKSYVISHANLRAILSKYLNKDAKKIGFSYNKFGKPFLQDPKDKSICFNLSHSGNFCLIGVTRSDKIGVDIEKINKEFSSLEIAKNYFSKKEYSEILNLPIHERTKAFYYCWTRKEAYIKAEGKGLSIELDSFDVTISEKKVKILRINDSSNVNNWQLYNLPINDEYCASVALYGIRKKITKIYEEKIVQI